MPTRRHIAGQAALIAAAWASTAAPALALLPLPTTPVEASMAHRHVQCARAVSNELADHLAPVLARQGAWIEQAERETRVAFGLLRERYSPGRGSVSDPYGVFTAMLELEADPAIAAKFATADAAAQAAAGRHFALVYGLEYLLRAWPLGTDPNADAELDQAFERLLGEAEADVDRLRRALFDMGVTRGVHFVDRGLLQQVRTVVNARYEACMQGSPEGMPWAVTGLRDGYGAGPAASPGVIAHPAAAAAFPNRGALRNQVLDPDTLRLLFSRTYAIDTLCHARAAGLYRDVMREFLTAAEHQAANMLEREHVARMQRGLAEFDRLRRLLDSNLKSARDIDDALAAGKRVDQAGTGLRNLEGHAKSTRDRMQQALDAIDAPAVAASLAHELDARARYYAAERVRLDAWVVRHAQAWPPDAHPAFSVDSRRGRDPEWGWPYTVQVQDRYLRGHVQAVANLGQAVLAACWEANLPSTGLVNAGSATATAQPEQAMPLRGCHTVAQLKSPFGSWDFMRVVEHVTAERCSVMVEILNEPLDMLEPPRAEADIARLRARAREDAAVAPPARLADAFAALEAKVTEAGDALTALDQLHADIRRKLAQPPPERLAVLASGGGAAPSREGTTTVTPVASPTAPGAAHPADPPSSAPQGMFDAAWQRLRDADRRLGEWTQDMIAISPEMHRAFNPQGDTTLAKALDYVNTNLCILTSIPLPPRAFKDVVETVFEGALSQVGWMGHCKDYVSGPYAPGGR